MIYTLEDWARQFYRLLPSGDMWPDQEINLEWHQYIRALVCEQKRVGDTGGEWLEDFFPDQTEQQLEDWERALSLDTAAGAFGIDLDGLTLDERRALVLSALRAGAQNVAQLEQVGADLGFTTAVQQPQRRHRVAGYKAGDGTGGHQWPHTFIYRYMPDIWTDNNDFPAWSQAGSPSITPDVERAPDGTLSADRVHADGGGNAILFQSGVSSTPTHTFQMDVWAKSATGAPQQNALRFVVASMSVSTEGDLESVPNRWKRFSARLPPADAQATVDLGIRLQSGADVHLWGARSGLISPLLEFWVHRNAPVHAFREFRTEADTQTYDFTYP